MPIHELVHSIFRNGPLASLRLPSLAGSGLPERMRSTVFALLGLTAAAGLALVAIFAQPGFPLLEPVPLPHRPPAREGVARALALPPAHSRTPLAAAGSGLMPVPGKSADGSRGGDRAGGGPQAGAVAPEGVSAVPAPVADAPEGSGGGGHGPRGGAAAPAATATPQPASAPASTPASTPQPVKQAPEAITSSAGPGPAHAPGSSSSAAAAEHASERGVEASSKGPGPAAPEANTQAAASTPGPPSSPVASGQGNGYAKGQSK